MARKLKKKLPKAQFGLIDDVAKLGQKYLPKIFPKPIPPSVLGPMKTFKVGKNPALTFDDWRSYIETGNVQPAFEPFFSKKAGQHILPTFAPVDEFGTVGLTGDLVRKESNRFNNLVFDRGLMIAPAQGTGRKSVHFTGTGKPVPSHLMGNWDHVTTTFTLPMADAIRYNAMPRSTAPNDVYFYSPRQFVYPPSTKILTGDMELASNARGIGLDVNFNKELFKLNKQLNKIEELKNTPGTKYSYNESTSSGNFNSDKYNLYKKDREPLVRQVKALTDDWLTGLNLQGIDHLNPAYKLGFRDFDPNLRNDLLRNIRSSSESPYVHSESPEFKYYMEGLKDSSGLPLIKSRSQRIDENPSLIFDDVTMEQAKDPKYSLFDNAKIYKGGYEKAGMVEPSQADLILYQKQIFSYPKEYVEKILANYDAKNFPKDGPYRKILENYIKDGSAGVKYDEGGETDKNTITYSRLLKRFIPSAAVIAKNPLLTFTGAMLYPNTLGKGSTLETPSLEQQYQNYLNFTTPEERIKNELEYEVMTGKPFTFDPQPLPNQQHGGSLAKAQDGTGSVAYSLTVPEVEVNDTPEIADNTRTVIPKPKKSFLDKIKSNRYLNAFYNNVNPLLIADNALQVLSIPSNIVRESIEGIGGKGDAKFNFGDILPDLYNTTILDNDKKQQPVSDVLGVEGFFPSLAVDIATDPASYVGAGVLKNLIQKGGRKTVPQIIKTLDKTTPGGGDMFVTLKTLTDANPIAAKKLKLNTDRRIQKLIKNDPDRAQLLIDNAVKRSNAPFSKINFLDNVKLVSKNRAKKSFDDEKLRETVGGPGLPGVQFKNIESFINKLGDDGTTALFRYGESPLNKMQPFGNTKFGYYSADPFDAFDYAGRRDLPGPTSVFRIDLPNEFLTRYYKSKDFGKGSRYDALTRFIEFEVPEFRINQSNLQNLGTIDDYRKYLGTLKQSGGELPKAQGGLNFVKEAGKYLPSLKSITNPFGRLNFKFNPYPVIPKSQLLIPGRTYGDVQHKIPSLIRENQRTDTPGISSFIMPRGNLNYGKVFSDDMGSRITTFMGEGQMLNEPFKLMDGNTRFWLGEQMGKNWDNFYRGLQFENKNLFPEISKFDLQLDYKPDGQLAWFKPDGTEYTDLINLKKPFPTFIAKDKTSPQTLLQGPRKIKDRADLENQFNIRNTAYHTINLTNSLKNNEGLRTMAKYYGYNPDDDKEFAMFLATSPGGSGRRGGFSTPEGYDILFSGNDPKVTLERYGNMRANPFTVKFNLLDDNVPLAGGDPFAWGGWGNSPDNLMPAGIDSPFHSDLKIYDKISALDTRNTDFPNFGIANPFEFDPNLGMFKFKQGLNPDDYQGLVINPNSLNVPGLTQTNLIFGKENIPVRKPINIFTPDEILKGKKEYGGQTPWLALDDTPDRTYEDGGAVRTSLSEYEDGGEPNYNQMLIKFIKEQEAGMEYMKAKNSAVMKPDGSGYYKRYEDGKFYPYYHQNSDGTFEKEATIAYGTKGADIFDLYKEGISVPEAEEQLNKSLNNAHRKTKIYVDANYGEGFYDNLTDQKKAMLADFTYNLGRLSKYPRFAEGILTDNTDLALAEYIRGEQEGGAKLARNEAYLETFLQPWVDQTLERKKKEEEEEKLRLLNQKRDNIMKEKYSSWYSPFVPNSIENLFKQNYDWEDQYWKDKGITTYQDGGEDSKKYVSPYEKYGGIDEYSKMLKFLSYQQALKSGNKTMSDFYDEMYGFGDMSFDDMYGQARKIYEIGLNNPDDYISQRLIGRMVDSEGRPEFQYKGQPYNPYSYTELATDKYRQVKNEIANRIEGILGNPDKQNTQYTRTINPTSGKYEYEPVTVPTGASGRFPVGALPPMALSEDVFRNEGDLQKYIDEQFPEGSKERAFIDANPEVKKNWESLVAAYEQQRPHIVYGNELQLFDHIFDPESNKYIHNFTGDNKRYIELQQKRCAEIKQKFPTYNCDTGMIEGTDRNNAVISADNRSDWQRERDRKHQEMIEYNKQNKIPPNMMFMVHSSPGLSSMYNQAQRTGDYSAINQQVINFSPSNPENLALGATTIAGGPILRGIGNFLKTPAGRFVPKLFNPNVARPVTVGDAINVGFGAYGTAKHGPSMISNLMEGEYGDAAKDLGNLALYNIGVPSSLGVFNRGMNFGKVFPGQFTKSVVPQRNITPSTLDAFKTKYPNLNPSLSPQQYEGFAAFSQQLPNYSLINPIRTTFPGTQRFIGQPKLTQSAFDNIFKNLNQGATIVK